MKEGLDLICSLVCDVCRETVSEWRNYRRDLCYIYIYIYEKENQFNDKKPRNSEVEAWKFLGLRKRVATYYYYYLG